MGGLGDTRNSILHRAASGLTTPHSGRMTREVVCDPDLVDKSTTSAKTLRADFRPEDPRSSEAGESPECVYTSPFTLPSTTIKNTHHNKRNWSKSRSEDFHVGF